MTRRIGAAAFIAAVALVQGTVSALAAEPPATDTTVARDLTRPVAKQETFELPITASHVAVHWRGNQSARLRAAYSRDGTHFGRARPVELDDVSEAEKTRETYGAITPAPGAKAVRLSTDRPLERVTVLALKDRGPGVEEPSSSHGTANSAAARDGEQTVSSAGTTGTAAAQPPVIPRSDWGADESLRFDAQGNETWPPTFYPTKKLIVHHTAGQNSDPDPPATVRSIYYYHAITRGWGDIGYNFLIDESGRVYEGRYSRQYAAGESPTGEDLSGNGVTAGHATGFNAGTTGIALLGSLTNQDATPAARTRLEDLLGWEADPSHHNIDPQGSSLYTNPISGAQKTFANIAGHRDVEATECPGGFFYSTLPQIRENVAALIAGQSRVKHYRPVGYELASGSVYSGRGAVSRLYEDDESRVEISSTKVNGSHVSEIHPHASISAEERASLRKLTLDYNGNASGTSTATTLRVYNFQTSAWETVDGPRTGVTADRSFTWSNTTMWS